MPSKRSPITFSVIIPMLNEKEHIATTLQALEAQTFKDFEIICVDNGSTDGTVGIVKKAFAKIKHRKILKCNIDKNSYLARMTGANQAAGEILAFLDADCRADKNWLKNAYKYFSKNKCDSVAGEILNDKRTKTYLYSYDYYSIAVRSKSYNFFRASCGNALYRKTVFFESGGFDILSPSGSDIKLSYEVSANGYKCKYARDVIVYHNDDITLNGLVAKEIFRGYWTPLNNESNIKRISDSITKNLLGLSEKLECVMPLCSKKQLNDIVSSVEILSWNCGRLNRLKDNSK